MHAKCGVSPPRNDRRADASTHQKGIPAGFCEAFRFRASRGGVALGDEEMWRRERSRSQPDISASEKEMTSA